jgi:hypothetical protein
LEGEMMKAKHVQGIICSAIFFLFANQAWAAENWTLYWSSERGKHYYNKNSITIINKNTVSVWTKILMSDKEKKKAFSVLKDYKRGPDIPDKLSHMICLHEFDCVSGKHNFPSFIIFDNKNTSVYSDFINDVGWEDIPPRSAVEVLKNIVCSTGNTSKITKIVKEKSSSIKH